MRNLLPVTLVAIFIGACAAPQQAEKAFHPTDDVNSQSTAGKGFEGDGSVVDFGLDEPAASAVEAKAFHPTDALLIGGNGGYNPKNDDPSVVQLESNQ